MNVCSICLFEIYNNQTTIKTNCNHTYHFDCFMSFLFNVDKNTNNVKCPLCRTNMNIKKNILEKLDNTCIECKFAKQIELLQQNIVYINNILQ